MKDQKIILEEVKKLVKNQLGLSNIETESRFMEDLGAESVDIINIIGTAEDKFNIDFEENDIPEIRTVKQLFEYVYNIINNGQ